MGKKAVRTFGGSSIVSLLLLTFCAALGQSPTTPAFEVASIRPATFPGDDNFIAGFIAGSGACGKVQFAISGNRATFPRASLCGLIRVAYDVPDYRIAGVPAALSKRDKSSFYDVQAIAGGAGTLTEERMRAMLQTLLADRFQLKLHRESKELPIYALVVAKNGSKLSTQPVCDTRPKFNPDNPVSGMTVCKPTESTAQLALDLAARLDRPVVDKTGLTGLYAFSVTWGLENARLIPNPDIFTAVQEQLGLKLEPQKLPMDMLVIERAEPPSTN